MASGLRDNSRSPLDDLIISPAYCQRPYGGKEPRFLGADVNSSPMIMLNKVDEDGEGPVPGDCDSDMAGGR